MESIKKKKDKAKKIEQLVLRQCRHGWRMGSGIGSLEKGSIECIGRNIWCEKCGKMIKAYYLKDEELER